MLLGTQSISGDGRFVTYVSGDAGQLPPGAPLDPNGEPWFQAVQFDRSSHTTAIVSRTPSGALAERGVGAGMIGSSADGRLVAFVSASTDLVPGFPGNVGAVFLRDTVSGQVALASPGLGGAWPDRSVFPWQVLVVADAAGAAVVSASDATNLVAGDTNGVRDVFVAR